MPIAGVVGMVGKLGKPGHSCGKLHECHGCDVSVHIISNTCVAPSTLVGMWSMAIGWLIEYLLISSLRA